MHRCCIPLVHPSKGKAAVFFGGINHPCSFFFCEASRCNINQPLWFALLLNEGTRSVRLQIFDDSSYQHHFISSIPFLPHHPNGLGNDGINGLAGIIRLDGQLPAVAPVDQDQ